MSTYRFLLSKANQNQILMKMCNGKKLPKELYYSVIINNPYDLAYIKKPTKNMIFCALKLNPFSLLSVEYQKRTYEMCLFAVQLNGLTLQYVNYEYKTDEICAMAVKQNPIAIQYVEKCRVNKILEMAKSIKQ
jgi:hypothetical protein